MKYFLVLILAFFVFVVSGYSQEGDDVQDSVVMVSSIDLCDMDTLDVFKMPFESQKDVLVKNRVSSIQPITKQSNLFFCVLLALSFFGVSLYSAYRESTQQMMQGLKNINVSIQQARIAQRNSKVHLWGYSILFFLAFSFSFWISLRLIGVFDSAFYVLGLLVMIYAMLEYFGYIVIGFLLRKDDAAFAIRYNIVALSILGFWVSLIFGYLFVFIFPSWRFTSIILFFLLFTVAILYKEIRVFQIVVAEKMSISVFYFFLYICTFKILPTIVLLKFVYTSSFS